MSRRRTEFIGAIDQGTQSTRFVLYDAAGAAVASHQQEFTQHCPRAGYATALSSTIFSGAPSADGLLQS